MPAYPLQLIVATFANHAGASHALDGVVLARGKTGGILDAVAVTRAAQGGLLLQGAAEPVADGGFEVSALMARILALLETADARARAPRASDVPVEWKRAARLLAKPLRPAALILTPATSALFTIVAPSGAAEVVGVVLNDAFKLVVEDLPPAAVSALASEPALLFTGAGNALVLQGVLPYPHAAFSAYLVEAPVEDATV